MKKIVLIIALLVLIAPVSAQAFSISGLWNKIFKADNEEVAEDFVYEVLDEELAQEKYEAWVSAYENNSLAPVFAKDYYVLFSNAEINYILGKRLADLSEPPVDSFNVQFKEGYVYLEAHMIKYLRGNVSGDIEFIKKNHRTVPHIIRAKYGKMPIPSFLVNIILNKELEDLVRFIHSNLDRPYIDVRLEEDFCQLMFKEKED